MSSCILWTGRIGVHGYGVIYDAGRRRTVFAHRFVSNAKRGEVILHTCDNPACVNPEHLVHGTQRENIKDAIRKGRFDRYWNRKNLACPNGHKYVEGSYSIKSGDNGKPHKRCLICHREGESKRRKYKKLRKELKEGR